MGFRSFFVSEALPTTWFTVLFICGCTCDAKIYLGRCRFLSTIVVLGFFLSRMVVWDIHWERDLGARISMQLHAFLLSCIPITWHHIILVSSDPGLHGI